MFEGIWTRLHTHDTLSNNIQKTRYPRGYIRIMVPARIRERWCKMHIKALNGFQVYKALSEAKVSSEEFKMYWKRVQPTIPEEDLFRLFKQAFGLHHKADFINDILRRYQDMGEPVRNCVACLAFVSVCFVGLLLSQFVISCVLVALTDWTITGIAYLTEFVCLIRLRSTPPPRYLDVLEPFATSHVWRNMNMFAHAQHLIQPYSEDQEPVPQNKGASTHQRTMV